jgi:hypothetical protein
MGGVERARSGIPLLFALGVADCQGRIFAILLGEAAFFAARLCQQTASAEAG